MPEARAPPRGVPANGLKRSDPPSPDARGNAAPRAAAAELRVWTYDAQVLRLLCRI